VASAASRRTRRHGRIGGGYRPAARRGGFAFSPSCSRPNAAATRRALVAPATPAGEPTPDQPRSRFRMFARVRPTVPRAAYDCCAWCSRRQRSSLSTLFGRFRTTPDTAAKVPSGFARAIQRFGGPHDLHSGAHFAVDRDRGPQSSPTNPRHVFGAGPGREPSLAAADPNLWMFFGERPLGKWGRGKFLVPRALGCRKSIRNRNRIDLNRPNGVGNFPIRNDRKMNPIRVRGPMPFPRGPFRFKCRADPFLQRSACKRPARVIPREPPSLWRSDTWPPTSAQDPAHGVPPLARAPQLGGVKIGAAARPGAPSRRPSLPFCPS